MHSHSEIDAESYHMMVATYFLFINQSLFVSMRSHCTRPSCVKIPETRSTTRFRKLPAPLRRVGSDVFFWGGQQVGSKTILLIYFWCFFCIFGYIWHFKLGVIFFRCLGFWFLESWEWLRPRWGPKAWALNKGLPLLLEGWPRNVTKCCLWKRELCFGQEHSVLDTHFMTFWSPVLNSTGWDWYFPCRLRLDQHRFAFLPHHAERILIFRGAVWPVTDVCILVKRCIKKCFKTGEPCRVLYVSNRKMILK